MHNKILFKLGAAILLILSLTLILGAMASAVLANTAETRELTVTFDSAYCSVSYSINGAPMGALKSGEPVDVPYRSEDVKVTVTPISGYELKAIYQVMGESEVKQQVDKQERSYTHDFFNEDIALRIECETKTYSITFVPAEGETDISYNFVTDNRDKYENLTYTYGGDPVTIEPAVKRSNGYTFKYWDVVNRVVDSQGKISYEKIDSLLVDSNNLLTIESKTNIFSQWQQTGTIYLRPHFEPNVYKVYRYDYLIKYTDPSAGTFSLVRWLNETSYADTEMGLPMASDASGKWADTDVSPYPGYKFESFTTIKVDIDESKNIVYRYFLPVDYALTFDWNGGEWLTGTIPTLHTFNQITDLPTGRRTGYHFKGWGVLVNGNEVERVQNLDVLKLSAENESYALNNDSADQRKLTLVAIWDPVHYEIDYDLAGGKAEDNKHLPTHYIYNQDLTLPTPIRPGYRFMGWILNGGVEWTPSATESSLVLKAETYTANPTLKAKWEAIEYTVTLVGAGGTPDRQTLKVTYDQPLSASGIIIPIRAQYRFLGYYHGEIQYIDAEGNSVCTSWDISEDTPVLEARWELLPMLQVNKDDYKIDYPGEIFQFPEGKYTVIAGEQMLSFTVSGTSTQKIPGEFFGKTVELVVHSDGVHFSDYHGEIFLTARPVAPKWEDNGEIDRIKPIDDKTIEILLHQGVNASLLEFAISMDGGKTMLVDWTSKLVFGDLYPGTSYTVYARVKATDVSPSGEISSWTIQTDSLAFVNELLDRLEAMIRKDAQGNILDGEMLLQLIRDSQKQIRELIPHTPTFYADAEAIMTHAETTAPFARLQDEKIAALQAYLSTLLATKAYDHEGEATLNLICSNAITVIKHEASLDAEVIALYDAAHQSMSDVKISYLWTDDLHVTANDGLSKDNSLIVLRYPEFADQADWIKAAIAAGKVTYNGTDLTPKALIELLESQNVIGAYSIKMTLNGSLVSVPAGSFTIKLLLPEELRGYSNLRAAYYNSATGTLEVLESRTEGDYLIFNASALADFVILGDETLNLTAPIIALGIVALCQMVAIALILISRAQSGNTVKHLSVALPVFLAVQILPKNGELWVLILGALVVLLQIILMILLLNSELMHKSAIRRRHVSHRAHKEEPESLPTMAEPEEFPYGEPENSTELTEGLAAAAILQELEDAPESLEDEELEGDAQDEETSYEEVAEDYDFIEPAPATEYSLSDEGTAFDVFVEDNGEAYSGEEIYAEEGEPVEEYDPAHGEFYEETLEQTEYAYAEPVYDENGEEIFYEEEIVYEDTAADEVVYEDDLVYGEEAVYEEEEPIYGEEAVYEDEVVYEDELVYEDEVIDEEAEDAQGADAPYEEDASQYYYKNNQ